MNCGVAKYAAPQTGGAQYQVARSSLSRAKSPVPKRRPPSGIHYLDFRPCCGPTRRLHAPSNATARVATPPPAPARAAHAARAARLGESLPGCRRRRRALVTSLVVTGSVTAVTVA